MTKKIGRRNPQAISSKPKCQVLVFNKSSAKLEYHEIWQGNSCSIFITDAEVKAEETTKKEVANV